MILAEGVVGVHVALRVRDLRRLDVPEGVVGDRVEDLVGGRLLKGLRERVLNVLHEVVFLAVLKHRELLV